MNCNDDFEEYYYYTSVIEDEENEMRRNRGITDHEKDGCGQGCGCLCLILGAMYLAGKLLGGWGIIFLLIALALIPNGRH